MLSLPFDRLAPHKARQFVPAETDLGDWAQISPWFDSLEGRASRCATAAELERWLLDWSELSAALDQEAAVRHIAMTCHTEDAEAEKAYLHFLEKIEPEIKPRQFKLAQVYVTHPLRRQLPRERYAVFDRDTSLQVELFRPENVPLETEEARLAQQYQKLTGALTVQFRGEEKTIAQMAKYLEDPERTTRQEAWELATRRWAEEAERLEEMFDALVKIRGQIAHNAGFENYRDYAFRRLGRFDYTPGDCLKFHEAVESEIVPVIRWLQAQRRGQLGVEKLRPWDLAVDPLSRPALRPFDQVETMVSQTQSIFDSLDGELAEGFRQMQELRLLDLANRKGKAPGGYQSTLAEARVPFIFMNAVGVQRDVETILHEAGHAFHALATREEDLYAYRNAPIEFCEVASMSMELLGNEFLERFYNSADANRARRVHLEGVLSVLAWIATVDGFQHWIYTNPGHSPTQRAEAWTKLMERFGGDVDWTGHEPARAIRWHRQLHIYIHAFYYIEYGIAQLGALQIWGNSQRDKAAALAQYKNALKLGGSRPLPELFHAAGCEFDFSCRTIAPMARMLQRELKKMDGNGAGGAKLRR